MFVDVCGTQRCNGAGRGVSGFFGGTNAVLRAFVTEISLPDYGTRRTATALSILKHRNRTQERAPTTDTHKHTGTDTAGAWVGGHPAALKPVNGRT